LKHFASPEFWGLYRALPQSVQDLAGRNFALNELPRRKQRGIEPKEIKGIGILRIASQ